MLKDTIGKKKGISLTEGHIVVKNKKFKKSDIIVFGVCVIISLVIWIYAAGVERMEEAKMDQWHESQNTQPADQ